MWLACCPPVRAHCLPGLGPPRLMPWGGLALAELREKLLFLWELHASCVLRAGLRAMELGSRAVWSHGVLQQPEPVEATTVGAGATAGRAQLSEPA